MRLKWSREKPKVLDRREWYWVRSGSTDRGEIVAVFSDGVVWSAFDGYIPAGDDWYVSCEWAGPIPEPEEAAP